MHFFSCRNSSMTDFIENKVADIPKCVLLTPIVKFYECQGRKVTYFQLYYMYRIVVFVNPLLYTLFLKSEKYLGIKFYK